MANRRNLKAAGDVLQAVKLMPAGAGEVTEVRAQRSDPRMSTYVRCS
jgi:hypothetical protein